MAMERYVGAVGLDALPEDDGRPPDTHGSGGDDGDMGLDSEEGPAR